MTLEEILNDVVSVIKTVLNSSAMTPSVKSTLSTTLDNAVVKAQSVGSALATGAEQIITEAPAEASALVTTGLETAASSNPIAETVADVAAPIVSSVASSEVAKLLAVFEAHNAALMADLQKVANNG